MTIAESPTLQVRDDAGLLDTIVADQYAAAPRFHPTNYWACREPGIVAELRKGLHDFRRRPSDALAWFSASDSPPAMLQKINGVPPAARTVIDQLVTSLNGALAVGEPALPYNVSVPELLHTAYWLCELTATTSSQIVAPDRLDISRVGSPYGIEIEGRFLTRSTLSYYMRYAFVAEHIDFNDVDTVVELGSGCGKQAEILHQLHPHLTILQLDLAPALYCAERYMTASYPDSVVPCMTTRGNGALSLEPGKVHFLLNARIADVDDIGRALFWNAASFGEMEPNVVEEYGADASRFAEWVFLHQAFRGKERGTAGVDGVLEPVCMSTYAAAFPAHRMVVQRPAHTGLGVLREGSCTYDDTVWFRRDAPIETL
ncbi:MAG: putative sugar O-methyltransferase [Actinomycetota bacterium]